MKKINLVIFISMIFVSTISFGQDTISNKELKTKLTGLQISNSKNIKIRCIPSITKSNEALVVIDSEIYNSELLSKLNPANVKNVNVIKGAQGAALYGNKGSNGVIIVNTKDPDESEFVKLKNQFEEENVDNSHKKIISVSGVISDCEDIPLNKVIIKNLNSKEVFYSDSVGKYEIKVHKNDYLVFSTDDFYSQKVKIMKQKMVDVKLKVDIKLKTIQINTNSRSSIILRKPVIYLYPTDKTRISLKLDFKGKLGTTFPKYQDGWDLIGFPDGQIQDKKTKRYYNSLFWDGEQSFPKEHYQYTEGFEIAKNYLTEFLIQKLELIGFNNNETNDFIQFWLPILEKNELNFIHFYVNEAYDVFSKNIVNPMPETSIRVFMEFYKIDSKTYLPEQNFKKTIRNGFTLVEWGGSEVSIPMKEFTKSKKQ
jgi:TonB-dependent SusC/RagA subfamily outer membrane receptor